MGFLGFGGNRKKALQQAIQPGGAFTPNGAPTGFGQPSKPSEPEGTEYQPEGQPYQTQQPTPQPQVQAQPAAANPAWNTDGYAGPQYTAQNARQQAMAGWDQTKWANQNHQTPKYAVGRILSQFDPRSENVPAVLAEIQKAYPGARLTNGKEKVWIPGVGEIDLLEGYNAGGKAWQWGALTDKDGKPLPATPTPQAAPRLMPSALSQAVMPGQQQQMAMDTGSASARLRALLAQLQQGM